MTSALAAALAIIAAIPVGLFSYYVGFRGGFEKGYAVGAVEGRAAAYEEMRPEEDHQTLFSEQFRSN